MQQCYGQSAVSKYPNNSYSLTSNFAVNFNGSIKIQSWSPKAPMHSTGGETQAYVHTHMVPNRIFLLFQSSRFNCTVGPFN